ncbi:MAG: hypothetical protein JGK29_05020 [Microcoleus sp. PH2017_17_BER_D_A]|uniref:hypothetical protein n=1 Tax=Microcoleus sp. PH2017_16_JOR_D_A TaxID=2798827 RepID=UPI001D4A005E|nr:hypothetical protein [Microcoleus sp. PH2017_16_JOR_D_A]MCC3508515.1 hypothetical protein [Microcoleus sp. PH2017_17_BER_D_A]
MGWASRPSFIDGRDAHPTFKSVNYLIRDPTKSELFLHRSPQLALKSQLNPASTGTLPPTLLSEWMIPQI